MEGYEARPGAVVRVREGHRKPELEGMTGTVRQRWGGPGHVALYVWLEDRSYELFWLHQLDTVGPARVAYYDGG